MNHADLLSRPEHTFDYEAIRRELKGKRVLITGAGGSIGSAIARGICNSAAQFIGVMGHSELPIFNLIKKLNDSRVFPMILDVGSEEMWKAFELFNPDIVIHAAAHKHVGLMEAQPKEAFHNNTLGTIALARCAREHEIEKFVFISTDKAARPTSNMGASKRIAEAWLLANYPEATIVRFGNVLGSSGSLIEIAKKKIEAGEPFELTDPRMRRFFITPNEAVGLVLTSGLLLGSGLYTLDMGEQVEIEGLLYKLSDLMGKSIRIVHKGMGSGEKLSEDLLNIKEVSRRTLHEKIFEITAPVFGDDVDHAIREVTKFPGYLKQAANLL